MTPIIAQISTSSQYQQERVSTSSQYQQERGEQGVPEDGGREDRR
jgi:hypothetical protein